MHRLVHLRMKHMRLLEQLIECRTLRGAAAALHVSEPAASQMLRDMEQTFDVALFERGPRGMAPNAAADLLVNRARVILRELRGMQSDIEDLSNQRGEVVELGALPRCIYAPVPAMLARLYAQGFQPRVRITMASSSQLLESLAKGELDLALTRVLGEHAGLLSSANYEVTRLFDEETVIVCSTRHPLAARSALTLEMLLEYDWALPSSDSVTRNLIDAEFVNSGFVPPVPKVEGPTAACLSVVQRSMFLTICPASMADEWAQNKLLHILPLQVRVAGAPISIIWRTSKRDNPAVMAIREALLESV